MKTTPTVYTSTRKKQAGFTLVEVVVATFISMIGLAGAMSIGIWQLQATRFNVDSSEATAAGQEKLEDLSQEDYANIAAGTETLGDYEMAWTTVLSNRCKIVNLNISWSSGRTTHQITMSDLFADGETTGYIITD